MERDAHRPRPRVVAHLGSPDQGRTHRACRMAAADQAAGRAVFLLDADSDGGAYATPGTVGLVPAGGDGESPAVRHRFTGALLPWDDALFHVAAVVGLIESARRLGADVVHVDTTGYADGPAARRWLGAFLESTKPDAVVLSCGAPGTPLETMVRALVQAPVDHAPTPPEVVRKTRVVRATRRSVRIAKAFEDSTALTLPLDRMTTVGTLMGTGTPLPPGRLAWLADAIGGDVLRAELQQDGTACIWWPGGSGSSGPDAPGWIAEGLGARRLRWIGPTAWRGRIAARVHADGRPTAMVRIRGIVPTRQALLVEGKGIDPGETSGTLHFGRFRWDDDGAVHALPGRDAV